MPSRRPSRTENGVEDTEKTLKTRATDVWSDSVAKGWKRKEKSHVCCPSSRVSSAAPPGPAFPYANTLHTSYIHPEW